jgi:uncharacterized protein YjiK
MGRLKFYSISLFLLVLFLFSCKKEKKENELVLLASYPVAIPECSGLSFYGQHLLTVSDSLSKVYVISKLGDVIDSLAFTGKNLEGVVYNPVNQHTYIVEENTNEVVDLDASGMEVNRFFVNVENLIKKHGLEGISINLSSNHLYLVSEMAPGLLIECSLAGEEIQRSDLAFAQDYSSVFFDEAQQKIWILSDDSKSVTRCDLNGNPEKTWLTNLKKGEGLVIDTQNNRIYIITDEVSILYVFSF